MGAPCEEEDERRGQQGPHSTVGLYNGGCTPRKGRSPREPILVKDSIALVESPGMRHVARAVILAVLCLVGFATGVRATEYPGWGDTGWVYESKRECCNYAIGIASQYSEQACGNSGGRPSPFEGGGQRGSCSAQWAQDTNGNLMYRCYGEASVWCD